MRYPAGPIGSLPQLHETEEQMESDSDHFTDSQILSENVRVHELEAGHYDRLHTEIFNGYEQRHLWALIRRADAIVGKTGQRRALDLGAGTGNVTLKLLSLGYQVTSVDISPAMLSQLRTKVSTGATLVCSPVDDYLRLTRTEAFQLVAMSSVLHHLPSYEATLRSCLRLLAPGGVVVITHEPLAGFDKTTDSLLVRAVSAVSSRLWRTHLRKRDGQRVEIDYSLSDYHASSGIEPDRLASLVRSGSSRTVVVERRRVERLGVAGFLNSSFLRARPNSFDMIVVNRPPR
jgi:ubiquinone/menaquinone biosynthesis C-methylase UbiE